MKLFELYSKTKKVKKNGRKKRVQLFQDAKQQYTNRNEIYMYARM